MRFHFLSSFLLFLLPFSSASISSASISTVVPRLFEQSDRIEDALEHYRAAQVQIAAAKLKSLLQVDLKLTDSSEKSDDEEESNSEDVPTASLLLKSHFNSLLKSLHDSTLVDQILNLPSEQPKDSLQEFVLAKEREAAQKLLEAVEAVRQIQVALQIDQAHTPEITSSLLVRLDGSLDALQDEYEDFESIQKRLQSSKEDRRNKARKELPESQAKIMKILQEIAELVQN